MTTTDLQTLFDFHYWARDRVLDAAAALTAEQWTRDMGSSFRSIRDTLSHTFSSEWVWYERWQGRSPESHLALDQCADAAALRHSWQAHEEKMRAFLNGLKAEGIERVIHYQLFTGQPSSSRLWQMAQHVVNHATYHRGQVTTMLRQMGAAPAKSVDLIAYYRSLDAAAAAAQESGRA